MMKVDMTSKYILGIVGIVALVGIVVLIMNNMGNSYDVSGQAVGMKATVAKTGAAKTSTAKTTAVASLSVPEHPLANGATMEADVISVIGNTANLRFTYSVPESFRSGSAIDMSQYLIDVEVVGIDAIMQDWQTFVDASMASNRIVGSANLDGNVRMTAWEDTTGGRTYCFTNDDTGETWQTNDRTDIDGDGVTNSNDKDNTDGPAAGYNGSARDNNNDGDTTDPTDDHDGDGVVNDEDDYPNDPERSEDDGDDEDDDDDGKDDEEGEDIWYDSEGGMYVMLDVFNYVTEDIVSQANTESLMNAGSSNSRMNKLILAMNADLTGGLNQFFGGDMDYITSIRIVSVRVE